MPSIQLDPTPIRQLTSREMSQVLCGMLGGIAGLDPDTRHDFQGVLEQTLGIIGPADPASAFQALCGGSANASWQVAIGATVAAFAGWCDRADIEIAVRWVSVNLPRIFPEKLLN
jgi:hypothetical protein